MKRGFLGCLGLFCTAIGLAIFGTLLAKIAGADELVGNIGGMLTALGGYWILKAK